jgi:F0F1-type ATP synthase assembly protein I
MDEDVYRTPKSDLTNQNETKGSAVKAILIATVVDITATIFVGIVISIVYGVILASNGDSLEVITSKLTDMELTSNVSILALISGCLITVYAGYLCAKIVNYSEYKTVAILAIIVMIFGFVMGLSYYSIEENILLSLLTLCCVYFGAWIYVSKKKRLRQQY